MMFLHYRLEEKLGEGGYGQVWRAADPTGRRCALKLLRDPSPMFVDSLRDEVNKLLRLHGAPGIVKILDYDVDGPVPFVALELADGSLLDLLHGPIDQRIVAGFSIQTALCIQEAHNRGVIHRDIKPDNILLKGGAVRLCDFGLGKGFESMLLTIGGAGTPGYMAPEQRLGSAGPAADVYGLGATIYHLLTGQKPPAERSSLDPRWFVTCDARLAHLVVQMTAGDYRMRPTLGHCVAVLEATLESPTPNGRRAAVGAAVGGGFVFAALGLIALATKNTYDRNVDRYRGSDGTFRSGAWGR